MIKYFEGDALCLLKFVGDNSVDSVVTDPPAGIGFMGKEWDHHKGGRDEWIAWLASILKECHRVLKPGGHALVWSIPRTSHWTGMACEHAGFEVRDVVAHLQGQGFPKSLNIYKQLLKTNQVCICNSYEETQYQMHDVRDSDLQASLSVEEHEPQRTLVGTSQGRLHCSECGKIKKESVEGLGTALKPSREDWWLVRKPLSESTVAKNVVKHGTGALNIDGSRISLQEGETTHGSGRSQSNDNVTGYADFGEKRVGVPHIQSTQGRWPSHTLFDESAIEGLGESSRYFYVAKTSRSERNKGCENLDTKQTQGGGGGIGDYADDVNSASGKYGSEKAPSKNHHPTVKSIKLMEYLIKLITPPGGVVLDPFMGSGSTGVAAKNLGMDFIGIEREEQYFRIAEARLK